nr:MAG TPA: hypothetical protein [Caudoviricetes sp.]
MILLLSFIKYIPSNLDKMQVTGYSYPKNTKIINQ